MLAFAWAGITYVSFPAFLKQAGQAAIANCVDLKAVNFTGPKSPPQKFVFPAPPHHIRGRSLVNTSDLKCVTFS